jgi:hypothetical protein
MRSALATPLKASVPARSSVKANAGLKVFARMTKDRVSLKKDSKWRSDIEIYPVRPPSKRASLAAASRVSRAKRAMSASVGRADRSDAPRRRRASARAAATRARDISTCRPLCSIGRVALLLPPGQSAAHK